MSQSASFTSNIPNPGAKPLAGKVALVTGASRGIGAAVAKRYAKEGAHVILVARTVGGLEEVDDAIQQAGGTASLVPMDLTKGELIDELGGVIAKRWKKLDILVGNAAMLGKLTPISHIKPSLWQKVMDTNVTANYRLIRSMDPLLRAGDNAKALFVTSGVTQGSFPYWGLYKTSKAALEAMVETYKAEVAVSGVDVQLIDPGVVRTNMRAAAMPGEDPQTLPHPDQITDLFMQPLL